MLLQRFETLRRFVSRPAARGSAVLQWAGLILSVAKDRTRLGVILGELLDLIDQVACLVWFDEFGHSRLLQRGAQLVNMCRTSQECKFSVQPGVNDSGGLRHPMGN